MKQFICIFIAFFLFKSSLFAQVSITATAQSSTCSANGSISINISGGTAPYNIMLDGVAKATISNNVYTLTGVSTGNYLLQVTDNGGLISNSLQTSVGGNYVEPTLTGTYGNCSVTASVQNGSTPFEYAICYGSATGPFSAYQSSNVFQNVPIANVAYIRVKDACDNIYTAAVSIQTNILSINPSCTPVDSVTYNLQLSGWGGVPPYSYTCTTPANGTQTNSTGTFYHLVGCSYTANITDNCGHTYSTQNHSCLNPILSLDCIDCSNGTLSLSATGGIPPYTFSVLNGNNMLLSNNTGYFTGLGQPVNGQFYDCKVEDACGGLWTFTRFYCLDAAIQCENSTGFNGQVDFTIGTNYLANNAHFPIEVNCNGCTPANVTITSAAQLPLHFDGLMSGIQSISVTDFCHNVHNIVSGCDLEDTVEMIWIANGGGGGSGTAPSGSGQAASCGNSLRITCQTPNVSYELYNLPSGTFYTSNTTGLFPFIPPAIYEIHFVSATGHLIKKDTFDTSFFLTEFRKDCRNLFVGACPTGLVFALNDKNGVPLQVGNTSGIFTNLLPGKWYQVVVKDTINLKTISKWVLMDSIGTLKYDIVNCQDLQAHLTLPQNAKGDTIVYYTLTGLNGAYNQQNQTGNFPSLANGAYQLMVTRGNCDTLFRPFTIGAAFNPSFCTELMKNPSGNFAWRIRCYPPVNSHYLLFDANGNLIPQTNLNIYENLPLGDYTFASAECAMSPFELPNFPDTALTAIITSYCSNLACIQASGAMGATEWESFGIAHNLSICYPTYDLYRLYKNNQLIETTTGNIFCNLTSGGNYMLTLDRLGTIIDTAYVYIPPYLQPNLEGTTGFVCSGSTTADIELHVDGNGIPFTFYLLNPPAGYTPTQITSNSPNVIFPNLPVGLYDFMVYDGCGASSDFSSRVTELDFVPTWIRYCDGTIQLFAPNYANWQYTWTNSAGVVVGTTYNPLIINPNAETYNIMVQVGNCSFSTTVSVTAQNAMPSGILTYAGADKEVPYSYLAAFASTYLEGNAPNPNEAVQWLQALPKPSDATITSPFNAKTKIVVYAPGIYTFVYMVYHAACTGVDTVRIHFFDCGKYEIEVLANPEGCRETTKDGSATVNVTGGTGPYT